MNFNDRDEIIALTPQWKGERLPDGRPKVEDKYLKALKNLTLEEVWKPILSKVTKASLRADCAPCTMTEENLSAGR